LGDLSEQMDVDFGVDSGRFNGPMPQNRGNAFEPYIGAEHLAGCRMTEDMGPAPGTLNAGTPQGGLCNVFDRVSGSPASERSERSHRAQEEVITVDGWAPATQILQQGIPNLLWQWQLYLAASLARDFNRGRLEADIL
jgi:hypothetical protein